MKRLLIKTALLIITSVTIMSIIMLQTKDNYSLYSHEQNVALAYNRLKALSDTNKIVIIAGSNGSFSINSHMIAQAFQMPVINTSTHAGIGVRMQFEIYKELLHKGDIVIFCPEYDSGKSRLYGGSTLFRILTTHMPQAYRKVSLKQWLFIFKYIGVHYSIALGHLFAKDYEGPYSAHSLNEYGDIECERPHQDSIKSPELEGKMDEELITYYKYIHSYSKDNGIKLVFLPPTFNWSSYKKNEKQIDSIAFCLKQNGIPYQASTIRYTFPDSLYFDTPYHMTQSGANKRTAMLIEDLERILSINIDK